MILLNVGTNEVNKYYGSHSELADYEIKQIEDRGVDLAAYEYYSGSYEGGGNLIYRLKEQWQHTDLSHCSCNGPLDGFYPDGIKGFDTLESLKASMSEELANECGAIFAALGLEIMKLDAAKMYSKWTDPSPEGSLISDIITGQLGIGK